jgi:predicted metal-dependent phosphoesterase TrpH
MICDLHLHTKASDGTYTPAELVMHARENGLTGIAITDHDTIDGIEEALEAGQNLNYKVIAGTEISVEFKPEMHLLAYFFDEKYKNLEPVLKELRSYRNERNPRIIKRLNELGIDITMEEVIEEAGEKVIGRPHMANILIRKGHAKDINQAFKKYLAPGGMAYFKKEKLTPKEGVTEIVKAGGIPVLAHPKHLNISEKELDTVISELVQYGLRGIECYYVDNTAEETGYHLRLAKKYSLLVTGGTDFHGATKPLIKIGTGYGNLKVPATIIKELEDFYIKSCG